MLLLGMGDGDLEMCYRDISIMISTRSEAAQLTLKAHSKTVTTQNCLCCSFFGASVCTTASWAAQRVAAALGAIVARVNANTNVEFANHPNPTSNGTVSPYVFKSQRSRRQESESKRRPDPKPGPRSDHRPRHTRNAEDATKTEQTTTVSMGILKCTLFNVITNEQ